MTYLHAKKLRRSPSTFGAVALAVATLFAATARGNDDCQHGDMDPNCTYKAQRTFDYMYFVQSWQGTFCADGCCIVPTSSSGFQPGFGIHGMWPQYTGGAYPTCCQSNLTDSTIDSAMAHNPQMRKLFATYWPALKKCGFVRYETQKHGTCAAAVYGSNETAVVNYWTGVINLRRRWDLLRALQMNGIVPSQTALYSTDLVREVLRQTVGYDVNLACSKPPLLDEVRICIKTPRTASQQRNPVAFNCPDADASCGSNVMLLPVPKMATQEGCEF